MRILVAGGSGFLGRALVAGLRDDGHEVRVLTRRPQRPGDVAWAPDSGELSPSAVDGIDAIINLAGEPLADGRWTPARKVAIRNSRISATRALVDALRGSTAGRSCALISSSAIGVYGLRGAEPLDETAALGNDFLASVCRDWEEEASRASAVARVVLLRTGLVLSKDGGALPQLAQPFTFFVGGPLGSGRQYMSWIHLADWIAVVRLALSSDISGPLNATAPVPVTNAELARALGAAMHRPAWLPAPAFAMRLLLGEMADAMILGGQRVLPARAEAHGLRFRFRTVDDAMREIYGKGT